jgi:hypothetical protein
VSDQSVPVDWREARRLVAERLEEWGPSRFQQMVVWSIAENESTAAALHYIGAMRELEVSDGAATEKCGTRQAGARGDHRDAA